MIWLSLAALACLVLNLPGEKELSIPDDSESSNGKASFIIKYLVFLINFEIF